MGAGKSVSGLDVSLGGWFEGGKSGVSAGVYG